MMNEAERATWRRLEAHDFDAADVALPFSRRLARENGWSTGLTARVIDEYRRFCFLARHADHPVTPSDEVDQAWHLHLLYTRDYWEQFCPRVLGKALHHGPTAGGSAEDARYEDWYGRTKASYRRYFGDPPEDCWPGAATRFGNAGAMRRIDTSAKLVIDRRALRRGVTTVAAASALATVSGVLAADAGGASALGWLAAAVVGLAVPAVIFFVRTTSGSGGNGSVRRKDRSDAAVAAGGYGGVTRAKGTDGKGDGGDGGDGGGDGGASSGCGSGGCGGGCGG